LIVVRIFQFRSSLLPEALSPELEELKVTLNFLHFHRWDAWKERPGCHAWHGGRALAKVLLIFGQKAGFESCRGTHRVNELAQMAQVGAIQLS